MKSILFAGNGLNRLIANIIRNYPRDKAPHDLKLELDIIANKIDDVAGLWERFKYAFPKIKQLHPNLCDEQIFSIFNEFTNEDFFKEEIPESLITKLSDRIDIARKESLKEIAMDFKRFEDSSGHRTIRRLFPSFGSGFENMLNYSGTEEVFICTTNYDGILDTLLTYPVRVKGTHFIYTDAFRKSSIPGHLKLNEHYLKNAKRSLVNLHGSYKFTRKGENTYKLTGNIYNNEPVLVFNNPFLKEKEILSDQVLSSYYRALIEKLKTHDRIIIVGNSFKNEPHIKELISKYFNRSETEIVVCDLNPEEVVKELQSHYSKEIYQFSTRGVSNMGQLFNLLYPLFMPDIMHSNKCINNTGFVA